MPKLYNTVTNKFMFVPDSYVGKFPFETEEQAAVKGIVDPATAPVEKPKKKKSSKAEYKADAVDGDADGLVQDGTPFQRPEGTELTEEEIATRLDTESK